MVSSKNKLVDIVDDDRKPIAEKLMQEMEFMDATLSELKAKIRKDGAVMRSYPGLKVNPALTAYNTTIQRYALLNKQLIGLLPPAAKPEAKDELAEFLKKGKSA